MQTTHIFLKNGNWAIIYVIHVTECDETINVFHFQHTEHMNKSECVHVFKLYLSFIIFLKDSPNIQVMAKFWPLNLMLGWHIFK